MFIEFEKEVEQVLKEALEKASYEYKELEAGLDLEESEHADIASRVAFSLARTYKKPPEIIAADIVNHLEIPAEKTLISNAVAAGPYINFYANDFFLHKTLQRIKKADHAVADVYIAANRMVEENSEFLKDVEALMRKYEARDEAVVRKYEAVVKKCLSGIQASLQRLNIRHDLFIWESEFVRRGAVEEVIEELKQKGNIKFDGSGSALLLQLEGIEKELVIQRTDGTSLYTTRDLAYHRWKSSRCDRVIDVFGKDHELVSQQLAKTFRWESRATRPIFYSEEQNILLSINRETHPIKARNSVIEKIISSITASP